MQINNAPRFTKAEEKELHRRMQEGDVYAKNQLALSVLPWSLRSVQKYRDTGVPVEDLEEIANFAVAETLNRWDPERGRLITAVSWAVWANYSVHRAKMTGPMAIPVYLTTTDNSDRNKQSRRRHAVDIERGMKANQSLDVPLGLASDSGGGTIAEIIPDPRCDGRNTLNELIRQEDLFVMRFKYRWAMDNLPNARHRGVLRARWEEELTLEVIGKRFNVTKERVRQIETKAKAKFKRLIRVSPNPDPQDMPNFSVHNTPDEAVAGDGLHHLPRPPQGAADVSLTSLLEAKKLEDIDGEIRQLDDAMRKMQQKFRSRKSMLQVFRKAIVARDGDNTKSSTGASKVRGVNIRQQISDYLGTVPTSTPREIAAATGLTKPTVSTQLLRGKDTVYENPSHGRWRLKSSA